MELSRRFMPLLRSLAIGRWIFAINMSRLTALPRYSGGFSTEPRISTIVRLSEDAFDSTCRLFDDPPQWDCILSCLMASRSSAARS